MSTEEAGAGYFSSSPSSLDVASDSISTPSAIWGATVVAHCDIPSYRVNGRVEIWDKRKKELKEKRREISQEEEKCENPDAMGRAQ